MEFGDTAIIAKVGVLVGQGASALTRDGGANGRHNEVNSVDQRTRRDDVCQQIQAVRFHLQSGTKFERSGPQSRVATTLW